MDIEVIDKTKNKTRYNQVVTLLTRNAASYSMRSLCRVPVTKNLYNPCKIEKEISLGSAFLKHSFKEAAFILLATSKTSRTRSKAVQEKVVGFATVKDLTNALYIDAVCALPKTGKGTQIIKHVGKMAQEMNKPYVTLSALPHVIGLYEKMGFKRTVTNPRAKLPPCSVIRPGSKICENGCPMHRRSDVPWPSRKPTQTTAENPNSVKTSTKVKLASKTPSRPKTTPTKVNKMNSTRKSTPSTKRRKTNA